MKNKLCLLLASVVSLSCLVGCGGETAEEKNKLVFNEDVNLSVEFSPSSQGNATVDLEKYSGLPLFKKLSLFTIGTDKLSTINRDASKYLKDLRSPTMRYPMSLWTQEDDTKMYEYWAMENYDSSASIFERNGVPTMYWHTAEVASAYNYSYPGRDPNKDVRYYPPIPEIYARAWGDVARKVRAEGKRAYYEVLNECDHNGWWYGTWDDYIEVYNATAKGIREGDPDAEVGGLSSGGISRTLGVNKLRDFLTSVEENQTPIDFVSYHDYFDVYKGDTDILVEELEKSEYFNSTQMHLNEFNVYWREDFWQEEKSDTFLYTTQMLPKMFNAFEWLSETPCVTMAHWATFTDVGTGFGLFTEKGEPLPSYYALKLYQNMPIDSIAHTSEDEEVKIMASRDATRAGILVYNTGSETKSVSLDIKNNHIANGELNAYRIDYDNASIWENKNSAPFGSVTNYRNIDADTVNVSFELPVNGVVYLELAGKDTTAELYRTAKNEIGTLIRKDYYYDDRTKNTYSEYDDFSAIDYVGMGDNDLGIARNALTLENPADEWNVDVKYKGELTAESQRARVGVRIDYRSDSGEYVKSVMYVQENFENFTFDSFPYGTKKAPDQVFLFNDTINMQIKANAPEDWDGRILVTFEAIDAGKGSEAKFYL